LIDHRKEKEEEIESKMAIEQAEVGRDPEAAAQEGKTPSAALIE